MDRQNRIQFNKPDLPDLTSRYTVVDMHFHSRYTDGMNLVPTIAERARELGIGLAITDHNDIRAALELNQYKNLLNIPGIEVTSAEGTHLLVYFYDINGLRRFYENDLLPHMGADIMNSADLPMEVIIERLRKYRTVTAFAHPYSAAYTGVKNSYFSAERQRALLDMVDGIEVINAANINRWNLRCALLGFNLDKGIIGGSDGHGVMQMGKAVTFADCKNSRRAFLDAVKHRRTKVVGKEIDFLRKVTSSSIKLRSNLRNYPDLVEKNLRYSYVYLEEKSRNVRDRVRRRINGAKARQRRTRRTTTGSDDA